MKKILLLLLLISPFYSSAQQWQIGGGIGFHDDLSYHTDTILQNGRFSNSSQIGFAVGPMVRYQFSEPISLEAGALVGMTGINTSINLDYKGSSRGFNQLSHTAHTLYLNIPLHLMYSFVYGNDSGDKFTLYAGGNIYLTGNGKQESLQNSDSVQLQVNYENIQGFHLEYAVGFQFENALPSGNNIGYGLELRIGREPLAKEDVQYRVENKTYKANLVTAGPDILFKAVYYWSVPNNRRGE